MLEENQDLLQLKLDYIEFISQTNKNMGFDINLSSVLFALLLEQKPISQDEIMELTGLSRGAVSGTLASLGSPNSNFAVLKTRKPGDRKRYYYCPYDFAQYIRALFTVSLKTSEAFTDFVPPLLKRVEALPSEPRTEYFKELIQYLTRVLTITNRFSLESEQLVEEYFKVSVIDPTIFERIQQDLEENVQSDIVIPKDDTISKVKRDFINEMMALAAGLIKSKEQITIFLCLYIEPEEVNQDQIMEVTGYSRSTISEALKHLVNLETVKVIKRAGDRKKYYTLTQNIMDYGFSKLNWWRQSTKLITYMMNERFIPNLEKIDADPEEKKRLQNFFTENSENYTHLMEYVAKLYKYIEENNTRLPNF